MKRQKGFSLIEALVAVAVFSLISGGIFSSLVSASGAVNLTNERETSKNLAESQMEYVKGLTYATSYAPAPIPPEQQGAYTASIDVQPLKDNNLQKITVTITHFSKDVLELENFKVN